jgi:hypothetical protein
VAKIGSEQRFNFIVRALVNSEGGRLRFATGYQPECVECENSEERLGPFFYCNSCGRNPRRGGKVTSGDGDGIYPVVEVTDSETADGIPIAVLLVFDSNYSLANRISGEAQESNRPTFTRTDFSGYLSLPAVSVAEMEPTDLLVVGGGSRFEPAVDCSIQMTEDIVARSYVEGPGMYSGNFAEFNSDGGTTAHVPRLLAIGAPTNLDLILGRPSNHLTLDWEQEDFSASGTIVTSHVEVVADGVCFANANIADSYLRDMSRHEHAIRNWDEDFFSWVILGSQLGNEWCTDMLSTTFGVPDNEKQCALLARRVFGEFSPATAEILEAPSSPRPVANNFCSQCGIKFETQEINFCPNCGQKR